MKDFNYYSEPQSWFPSKVDFTTYYAYKDGECVFKGDHDAFTGFKAKYKDNLKEFATQKSLDEDGFKKARKVYNDEKRELHEEFMRDLYREFDVQSNPKRDKCFALAWDRGHSAGYYDVYSNFADLVELIQ